MNLLQDTEHGPVYHDGKAVVSPPANRNLCYRYIRNTPRSIGCLFTPGRAELGVGPGWPERLRNDVFPPEQLSC